MVAIENRANNFSSKICPGCDAKKNNSDSLYIGLIFPYTYFTDITISVGGITDV